MVVTARGYGAIHDCSLPDESRTYYGALGCPIGPVVHRGVDRAAQFGEGAQQSPRQGSQLLAENVTDSSAATP